MTHLEQSPTPPNFKQELRKWFKKGNELIKQPQDFHINPLFYSERWHFAVRDAHLYKSTAYHAILLAKPPAARLSYKKPYVLMTRKQDESFFNIVGGVPKEKDIKNGKINGEKIIYRRIEEETGILIPELKMLGKVVFPDEKEVISLYAANLSHNTIITHRTDPQIEEVVAISLDFFDAELVKVEIGESLFVMASIEKFLSQQKRGLSLTPPRFGT